MPKDNIRSDWQAHQEIVQGLASISVRQAHQRRVPKAPQKPVIRACVSLVQTGALLVGFAILGAMLAY